MKRCITIFLLLMSAALALRAQDAVPSHSLDSLFLFPGIEVQHDRVTERDSIPSRYRLQLPALSEIGDIHRDKDLSMWQKMGAFGRFIERVIDAFDDVDSSYIHHIDYNFTAMAQATSNFERYTIGTSDYSESIAFSQRPDFRIGPYFYYRWLGFGYTYDMTSLGKSAHKRGQKFEFSLYTSMIGLDLIYRKTGSDFFLRHVNGLGEEAHAYEGTDIDDYISTKVMGLNLYYTFNHRKFSNPAMYSQSAVQRRSAGSWQLGFSFAMNDIRFDNSALPRALYNQTASHEWNTLMRVKYIDFSINFGYAYNWAFARNWCAGISLQPAIGYKKTSTKVAVMADEASEDGEAAGDDDILRKIRETFRLRGNVNFDFNGRFGVVYNNGRWFLGAFSVVHNYNYVRDDIRYTNIFGNTNLYGGFYFQRKKH